MEVIHPGDTVLEELLDNKYDELKAFAASKNLNYTSLQKINKIKKEKDPNDSVISIK